MLRPAYLRTKLSKALPTKDGGTLRTIEDARAYMLKLKAAGDKGAMATRRRIAVSGGRCRRSHPADRTRALL